MAIAVVDDDDEIRDAVRTILEREGHLTVGAADGEEAWDMLERGYQRPSLILLDLVMPRMDGWEFLALIDEQPDLRAIPIALMSSHPNVQRALDRGGKLDGSRDLFLPKPLNVLRLLSLVARVCGRPELPC